MELEPNARYVRLASLFDYEANFRKRRGDDALIILNDIDIERPDHNEQIMRLTHSRSSGTDFIAKCECGELTGTYYNGQVCPKCHTVVKDDLDDATGEFPMRVWIRTPDDTAWLHPRVYAMLRELTKYIGRKTNPRSYIDDFLDLGIKDKDIHPSLKPFIGERGFAGLRKHWDQFLDIVFSDPKITKRTNAKTNIAEFRKMVEYNKDKLWINHHPILFESLHAIIMSDGDDESRKRYSDRSGRYVIQIASALSWLESQGDELPPAMFMRSVYRIYTNLVEYTRYILDTHLNKKQGLLRQHVFGARYHWSCRAVIAPITGVHKLDELHLPWVGAVNMLRVHILGRLLYEFKMTPLEAQAKFSQATVTFDPDIAVLMDRFIEESPLKGLPCFFGRNPSVDAGSLGLFRITKIKKDIFDKTIGFSPLSIGPPNADFDGDEMTAVLVLELEAARHFMPKHPSRLYFSRDNPEVSHHYGIPKALTIVANNFLGSLED